MYIRRPTLILRRGCGFSIAEMRCQDAVFHCCLSVPTLFLQDGLKARNRALRTFNYRLAYPEYTDLPMGSYRSTFARCLSLSLHYK